MTLDPSVDFGEIAKMTHDFSGADLQALIYNAHLRVVHAAIDASPTIRRSGHVGLEKRVDYVMLGGSGEKKILSRADESQLQKRVGEPIVGRRAYLTEACSFSEFWKIKRRRQLARTRERPQAQSRKRSTVAHCSFRGLLTR